ncbi:MAG: AI-2E family transporter [Actinomycetota bacterium]
MRNAAEPATPVDRSRDREFDLDPLTIFVAVGCFVAAVCIVGLVRAAPRATTAVTIGTLFALALNPVVEFVMRLTRMPRTWSVAAVFAIAATVIIGLGVLMIPPASRQISDVGEQLPKSISELGQLPFIGRQLQNNNVPTNLSNFFQQLPERLGGSHSPLGPALRSLVSGFFAGGIVLLLAVCLLLDGGRLIGHARRLVPTQRRPLADRLGGLAYRAIGRYVAGSLFVAAIAATYVLAVGLILRVPLAPLLALNVMLFDLVPQIGGAAGGAPFVIMGFSRSPTTGLLCLILFVGYTYLENNLIQPIIIGQAVQLSPVATMAAALIGVAAGGVVGALIAVPFVGASKLIYLELFPHGVGAGTGPELRRRRQRRRLPIPHRREKGERISDVP